MRIDFMNMCKYFERNYEFIKSEKFRECILSNETKKYYETQDY